MSRRWRGWVVMALALAAALAVAVWTTRDSEEWPNPLDPRNPGPDGAQALARVLADEGVDVRIARSADELESRSIGAGATVVVTSTSSLSPSTTERLRDHADGARVVLVDPTQDLVRRVDDSLSSRISGSGELDAACEGTDLLDGLRLDVGAPTAFADTGSSWATCFPSSDGAVLAEDDASGVVLFGAGDALANEYVTRADNAAIALRLLGQDEQLVWYVPDPVDAESDEAVTLGSLLPPWIAPGLVLAGLALLALLLWRVRRLGPLSTEPLPVVVRGVETAHSRGRMYRRSGDRGHAAVTLRRAARTDLAARLRLDRHTPPAAIAEATARHLGARTEDVAVLLVDDQPPPADDRQLVRLAEELTRLRREVRRG